MIRSRDQDYRERLAAWVVQLRDNRGWSQTELSRGLNDKTRTRVLRLEAAQQPVTLALMAELAEVFDNMPLIEFLAPILDLGDTRTLEEAAHRRLVEEIAANERAILERHLRAIDRPEVRHFVQTIANAAVQMEPQELGILDELVFTWSEKFGRKRLIRPDFQEDQS